MQEVRGSGSGSDKIEFKGEVGWSDGFGLMVLSLFMMMVLIMICIHCNQYQSFYLYSS